MSKRACRVITKSGPKIRGKFCERTVRPTSSFAPNSLRWIGRGSSFILIGCPKGKFRNGECAVGTKAHSVLKRV